MRNASIITRYIASRMAHKMNSQFWEGYAIAMSDDEIRTAFQKLHRRPPAEIVRDRAIVKAGSISEDEHRVKQRRGKADE